MHFLNGKGLFTGQLGIVALAFAIVTIVPLVSESLLISTSYHVISPNMIGLFSSYTSTISLKLIFL